ncbi:type II methionyl aminopeptidase [Candidatus Micrarchaeota archaeon]|nr:type II methionyl aminopeptidase [Candidatus Micrarchaeota archaeon]
MEPPEEKSEEEFLKTYKKVSRIGKQVKKYAQEQCEKESSLLKLAELVEKKTIELGANPAFPANLSRDEQAAHYTPTANDDATSETSVLKIDLGAHIDGLAVDFAFTKDFGGEHGKLVEAADEALQNALSVMKAGATNRDVGKEIERTIKAKGFKPIENLCGHSIDVYDLHAGEEVPNVERGGYTFKEGDVFAVEPFASTGAGRITEGDFLQIYQLIPSTGMKIRLPRSRELLSKVLADRLTLPFALRWYKEMPMLNLTIRDLDKNGVLEAFPVLKEIEKNAFIAQAETTVRIEKDGVDVLV